MDEKNKLIKLQIITFVDSLSYGVIYGFLSPYVLSLGADHFIVGVLAVGILLCNLISADIISNLIQFHGKQYCLFLVFNIALISHLLMILTNSYWFTIFARYIFSVTNQSQNLCKDLLLQHTPKDEHEYYLTRFSVLSAAGYIIGPSISGYLFTIGFFYDGLFAAVLTSINIYLLMSIPRAEDDLPPLFDARSIVERKWDNLIDVIRNFVTSDYKKNWDIIAIKYLYISSIIIFFSKFTQILKHNFEATAITIGCTSSYMNGLTFLGAFFATNTKDRLSNYSIVILIEYALLLAVTTLLFACYSPVYELYAFMCIPIIFSNSFINSIWIDLFTLKKNDSLKKVNSSVGILSGMTAPLMFGLLCNIIGHHAVIVFSIIPILASIFIIHKYTLPEEANKKNKVE